MLIEPAQLPPAPVDLKQQAVDGLWQRLIIAHSDSIRLRDRHRWVLQQTLDMIDRFLPTAAGDYRQTLESIRSYVVEQMNLELLGASS